MRILFDNGTPNARAKSLPGHQVTFARQIGWHELSNGELIERAGKAGTDLLLTTDKNIRYQQNLSKRRISLVVLSHPKWPAVQLHIEKVAAAVQASKPGAYTEVIIPATSA